MLVLVVFYGGLGLGGALFQEVVKSNALQQE
jgi:hypothetical protein